MADVLVLQGSDSGSRDNTRYPIVHKTQLMSDSLRPFSGDAANIRYKAKKEELWALRHKVKALKICSNTISTIGASLENIQRTWRHETY